MMSGKEPHPPELTLITVRSETYPILMNGFLNVCPAEQKHRGTEQMPLQPLCELQAERAPTNFLPAAPDSQEVLQAQATNGSHMGHCTNTADKHAANFLAH